MQRGHFGQLADAAAEWRSMIADGLHICPQDIPAEEYYALRVMREEEPQPKDPHGQQSAIGGDARQPSRQPGHRRP
jgi:hypothetical protein